MSSNQTPDAADAPLPELKMRPPGNPKPERNAEICRRYMDGESAADIAKAFNITRGRVHAILRKAIADQQAARGEES